MQGQGAQVAGNKKLRPPSLWTRLLCCSQAPEDLWCSTKGQRSEGLGRDGQQRTSSY